MVNCYCDGNGKISIVDFSKPFNKTFLKEFKNHVKNSKAIDTWKFHIEMTRHYQMHADTETKKREIGKLSGFMIPGKLPKALIAPNTAEQKNNEAITFLKSKKKLSDSEKYLLEILS